MKFLGGLLLGLTFGSLGAYLLVSQKPCPEASSLAGGTCLPVIAEKAESVPRPLVPTSAAEEVATTEAAKQASETTPGVLSESDEEVFATETTDTASGAIAKKDTKVPPLRDEKDIQSFLRRNRVTDMLQALANSRTLSEMSPEVEQLLGRYSGEVFVGGRSRRVWQMLLEFDGRAVNKEFRGNLKVQMSENGRVFSDSNGKGKITNVRRQGESGLGFFLEASPTHQFQFFVVPESDMLIGNLYVRNDVGQYRPRGTAHLYRQ